MSMVTTRYIILPELRRVASLVVLAMAVAACSAGGPQSPRSHPPVPGPAIGTVTSASPFGDPTGVAFDAGGDLWVCNYRASTLVMFRKEDLVDGSRDPAPTVVIRGLRGPNGLAFGRDGTLWVVDYDGGMLAGYRPEQLEASGDPAPGITIESRDGSLAQPSGLAFDTRGWLWVSNQRTGDVVAYRPQQLRRAGAPKPAVVLHMPGGAGSNAQAVAFDPRGRLWVALYGRDEVLAFDPGGIARSGRPRPEARIGFDPASGSPIGLAVDHRGRLWVVLDLDDSVQAFDVSATSGPRRPVERLEGGALTEPHGVTFDAQGDAWVAFHDDVVARYPGAVPGPQPSGPDLTLR